ncbi:MAG TPA: HAMP domain-containing sensor histidine kinase, partial [Nitrolancea sp.]|nr:HAMP domain-containing sensor histidine kinase [Nitrolancea sp.]
ELYAHQAAELVETSRLYREADRTVHDREEFLSTAAHELKTPLTTVKGYSQLLWQQVQRDPLDQARLRLLVEHLGQQVGRMELLVADLLDISRIQQGHLVLRPEEVDLVALAREVYERFVDAPERRLEHRLTFEAPEDLRGHWDPVRLDQILTNLLTNALKYSPSGGPVWLRIARDEDEAVVEVADRGVGMSREERARIFQPFSRAESASRAISGVGLGLYISAQIVRRHGGSIGVESEPGVGSIFTVRLPLGEQLRPPEGPGA